MNNTAGYIFPWWGNLTMKTPYSTPATTMVTLYDCHSYEPMARLIDIRLMMPPFHSVELTCP